MLARLPERQDRLLRRGDPPRSPASQSAILGLFGGYETERAITYGVSALLVLAAPIAIANGVLQRGVVDRRTILAALSIYVLVGMLWAFTELTIQAATSHSILRADEARGRLETSSTSAS